MRIYTLTILSYLLLSSCSSPITEKGNKTALAYRILSKKDIKWYAIPSFDTTIHLTGIIKTNYSGPKLTDEYAKRILYAHYIAKGCYTQDNLPDLNKITEADYDKLSVAYNTIYLVDLNGSKCMDAIVTYWLTPPYANGHCWRPLKAIISDTDQGFKVSNEEFLTTNFTLDSVVTQNQEILLYGDDYDCGTHNELRRYRARIK